VEYAKAEWYPGVVSTQQVLRGIASMRVDDVIRQSVLFVGRSSGGAFVPVGTGFMMNIDLDGVSFPFVVTARHNLEAFKKGEKVYLRINKSSGGTRTVATDLADWQCHPDAKHWIDVAVIPTRWIQTEPDDRFALSLVPEPMFMSESIASLIDLAPGSDIVTAGLFTSHANTAHNVPIVRMGAVAAMRDPAEPVYTRRGYMDAYLVELRSIGGLSGSPVFVQTPVSWLVNGQLKRPTENMKPYYLLGLMRGHFNVEHEEDMPKPARPEQEDATNGDRINSGIGVVVPADKIVETIMKPELKLWMEEEVAKLKRESGDIEDSGEEDDHRARFNRLLGAAAKPPKSSGRT